MIFALSLSFLRHFPLMLFAMQDSSHASLYMIMTFSACCVSKNGVSKIGWSGPDSIRRSSDYQSDVLTTRLARPLFQSTFSCTSLIASLHTTKMKFQLENWEVNMAPKAAKPCTRMFGCNRSYHFNY